MDPHILHETKEKKMVLCVPAVNYHLKSEISITLRCQLCSCNLLHSITNQLFKKHLYNQVATMKNTDDFCYKGKLSCTASKSTLFAVSKDEWDTKEDTGKSMKNALYVLQYAKRHMFG